MIIDVLAFSPGFVLACTNHYTLNTAYLLLTFILHMIISLAWVYIDACERIISRIKVRIPQIGMQRKVHPFSLFFEFPFLPNFLKYIPFQT